MRNAFLVALRRIHVNVNVMNNIFLIVMIWTKRICDFLCIGGVKSLEGCIVGAFLCIPIGILFALPFGVSIGGLFEMAGTALLGNKAGKISFIIGVGGGASFFVLILIIFGMNLGNLGGFIVNKVLKGN